MAKDENRIKTDLHGMVDDRRVCLYWNPKTGYLGGRDRDGIMVNVRRATPKQRREFLELQERARNLSENQVPAIDEIEWPKKLMRVLGILQMMDVYPRVTMPSDGSLGEFELDQEQVIDMVLYGLWSNTLNIPFCLANTTKEHRGILYHLVEWCDVYAREREAEEEKRERRRRVIESLTDEQREALDL